MTKRICLLGLGVLALASYPIPGWAAPQAGPIESTFDRAWASVVSGGRKAARAGDWVVEHASDGAVVAYRSVEKGGRAAAEAVSDAGILSVNKTRFAADPSIASRAINVDVDGGVVTLKGHVTSAVEAKTAVRLALQTSGVSRVVSRLTWPGMPNPPAQQ